MLEQAGRLEALYLVALISEAGADELAHKPTIMLDEESLAKALQGLLHALMAR